MIIILSSQEDPHAVRVAEHLNAAGEANEILNLSDFPLKMGIGLSFSADGETQTALRLKDGRRLDFGAAKSIWWRRPQGFDFGTAMTDPVNRNFAQQESDFAFKGMYQCSKAMWMNDVTRDASASHKPWQLDTARKLGMAIPKTLITNVPDDVLAFRRDVGKVIYKAFLASPMAWRETRVLQDADLAQINAISLAPVIFQKYIEAKADLRVTVVGSEVFAAAAPTDKADYATDIRMNPNIGWKPYELPKKTKAQLLKMMRLFGLEYGAADFRVMPDGTHVFLEINPAGQFLFIENGTKMPIAAAVAMHLAKGKAS